MDTTAICLTGQLRWPALTLATLRQFVLQPIEYSWRAYYVGPADDEFERARPLLLEHFVRPADACAYERDVSWTWRGERLPFEMHARNACLTLPRPRLTFNVDRLPKFGVCELPDQSFPHRARLPAPRSATHAPCSLELSLLLQMWQSAQSLALVERAEVESSSGLWHSRVLKMRTDIFFFHPVQLPEIPDLENPWYSLMEDTCQGLKRATHITLPRRQGVLTRTWELKRFVSDFWVWGNRRAMAPAMRELLRVALLRNGSERRDPAQVARVEQLTPGAKAVSLNGYYVQPWPHAVLSLFNATACLNFRGLSGVIRVNPFARCFTVHARLQMAHQTNRHGVREGMDGAALRASSWYAIDIGAPTSSFLTEFEAAKLSRSGAQPWLLPALAGLYRRCFGLVSKANCSRIVGDRQMTGRDIQPLIVTIDCRKGFLPSDLSNRSVSVGGCSGGALPMEGFACLDTGLARLLNQSRSAPRMNGSAFRAAATQ